MDSHEVVVNNVLQWLALHSTKARLEESLFQQELAEKDDKVMEKEENQAIDLCVSPIRREIPSFEAQDPLIKVNLRTIDEPRMTKISDLLI